MIVSKMSCASTSDHDMSESNSPPSYGTSPFGSPSAINRLVSDLTQFNCSENFVDGCRPQLLIIEQPADHFRFRYDSEMVGTHGCLLGKSYTANSKTKVYPTVELVNYEGEATIRCSLAQVDSEAEHPHRLREEGSDRGDVCFSVPEDGSYRVSFAGMGIIHTAKKDVPLLLFKKFSEQLPGTKFEGKMKSQCETLAKNINLNIVRLKFSAHDARSGRELCAPRYSQPIHNMKSAATNDLRIVRMSASAGRAAGGQDVYLLVEKVNKKNIKVRFFEPEPAGEGELWSAFASFSQADVHHQYAIVFQTPAYRDGRCARDVAVCVELVRPSDGRTSEPRAFTYRAERAYKHNRPPAHTTHTTHTTDTTSTYDDTSSSGSLTTMLPSPRQFITTTIKHEAEMPSPTTTHSSMMASPVVECGLGSALAGLPPSRHTHAAVWTVDHTPHTPHTDHTHHTSIPNISLNSEELNNIVNTPMDTDMHFSPQDNHEYLSLFPSMDDDFNSMGFIRSSLVTDSGHKKMSLFGFGQSTLVADSGRPDDDEKVTPPTRPTPPTRRTRRTPETTSTTPPDAADADDDAELDYCATYTPSDGQEVKQLTSELSEALRKKEGFPAAEVRAKLERLFNIRLSNGDTFLHMCVYRACGAAGGVARALRRAGAAHLLRCVNDARQTPLHLAVALRTRTHTHTLVRHLLRAGCDVGAKDCDGDDVIHYAVKFNPSCLPFLLQALADSDTPYDKDNYNNEMCTALHAAAARGCGASVRALLAAGWGHAARDAAARTPLHRAALALAPHTVAELLHYVPKSEVDATDGGGSTALQLACGIHPHPHPHPPPHPHRAHTTPAQDALEVARLLLEHGADPLREGGEGGESAWKLSRDKPPLRALIHAYVRGHGGEHDGEDDGQHEVKQEPKDELQDEDEEEYESAEEESEAALEGVPAAR